MTTVPMEQLFTTFARKVAEVLDPCLQQLNENRRQSIHFTKEDEVQATFTLHYVEHMAATSGEMCHFIVRLEGGDVFDDELEHIVKTLVDRFGCNDDPPVSINDLEWVIGDGDDTRAVAFRNGQFRIWVRGWPKSEFGRS